MIYYGILISNLIYYLMSINKYYYIISIIKYHILYRYLKTNQKNNNHSKLVNVIKIIKIKNNTIKK
jgi:hypothetical protein